MGQTFPTLLRITEDKEKWRALNEKVSTMVPQRLTCHVTS